MASTEVWQAVQVRNEAIFAARQGCGVAQYNANSILIIGGFHGKFSNETFFFRVDGDSHSLEKNRFDIQDNIFPFQVPTVSDLRNNVVYTVDWQ